jgi:hypothetical protein
VWKIEHKPDRVIPVLRAALTIIPEHGGDMAARHRAIHYLGSMGPTAKEAFPDLLKLWKDSTGFLHDEVARALKAIDASWRE